MHVRYWHLTDVDADAQQCPLLGVKRTSLIRSLMSANDPKRTSSYEDVIGRHSLLTSRRVIDIGIGLNVFASGTKSA